MSVKVLNLKKLFVFKNIVWNFSIDVPYVAAKFKVLESFGGKGKAREAYFLC